MLSRGVGKRTITRNQCTIDSFFGSGEASRCPGSSDEGMALVPLEGYPPGRRARGWMPPSSRHRPVHEISVYLIHKVQFLGLVPLQ